MNSESISEALVLALSVVRLLRTIGFTASEIKEVVEGDEVTLDDLKDGIEKRIKDTQQRMIND